MADKTDAQEIEEMLEEERRQAAKDYDKRHKHDDDSSDDSTGRRRKQRGLNDSQTSISVAFMLILTGIVAKNHWMQNFLQWIRQ